MKRTLIALAVGSAFAVPAAYADVTISGSINAGPAYVHQGTGSNGASNGIVSTDLSGAGAPLTTTGQAGVSSTGINTNYSNVTIASLEDLGGGLKLDFAYQLQANFQNTANGAFNRNSHIGLVSDSWGGVWYGTNEWAIQLAPPPQNVVVTSCAPRSARRSRAGWPRPAPVVDRTAVHASARCDG
jgi:predicted porin